MHEQIVRALQEGEYAILERIVTAHITHRRDLMVAAELDTRGARAEQPRRSRWLYALAALPPLMGIATALLAPEPHGHWVDHFSSVGFKATQLAVLLTVLSLLGWRTLSAPLTVVLVVIGVGIVLQVFGDAQVASAIWRTTGNPSDSSGYKTGHDLSEFGDVLVVLGGFGFVLTAALGRRVRVWLAACAAVLTLMPPPFLWPAAGVLLLLLHAIASGAGFARHRAA